MTLLPLPLGEGWGEGLRSTGGQAARGTKILPLNPEPRTLNPPPSPIPLHVLSDSTGNLAQHMLAAFLTQFAREAFVLRRRNFLQTELRLREALADVATEKGIVFHALVSPKAKKLVEARCRQLKVPCCDLTGKFVDFLSKHSDMKPYADPQRLHHVNPQYDQRIKALEYTLEHDDGLGLDTIHEADVVLAGVSRTSKTPTSIYLGQQGYRVANVSLAIEVKPPPALLALKRGVVGLVIDPQRLAEIRTNRQTGWRMADTSYNDPDHVRKEMAWSRRLFAAQGWPVLDVTRQAVEETAARVVEMLRLPRPGEGI